LSDIREDALEHLGSTHQTFDIALASAVAEQMRAPDEHR
jgi:hypothetical protein